MESAADLAKLHLYSLLTQLDPDTLSMDEVDLMYLLARDPYIQLVLSRNRKDTDPTLQTDFPKLNLNFTL